MTMLNEAEELRIGPLSVWPPVVLAPMAGVTNAPFRVLCAEMGNGIYVSEMITARAYLEGNAKTQRLASFHESESPRSIQLYGVGPDDLEAATRRLVDTNHVDHIDLNFGCPARKVTRHGGGAALPVRQRVLYDILHAVVNAAGPIPVTAKFRMGTDDDHLTYLNSGTIAKEAGCAAIALHARTARQLYSGNAQWDAIRLLKEHVGNMVVLGNGDIWEATDAVAMMEQTGCDGVVVGRGCLGRPWLFRDLEAVFNGHGPNGPPPLGDVINTMGHHLDMLCEWTGTDRGIREFRKHCTWYLKGYEHTKDARRQLNSVASRSEFDDIVANLNPNAAMTPQGVRAVRGHSGGPKPVVVPHGWYELAQSDEPLPSEAGSLTSGG